MKRTLHFFAALLVFGFVWMANNKELFAQGRLTAPPSGNNQKASVTQYIGLVKVTIDYSSPNVTGPNGEDRSGKIWGTLVPYGLTDLGFGPAGLKPWRAGANENTVFTVSHDVMIEGQKLPAGRYGLHMITDANEWTVIFSKQSEAWGSYFYKETDDALRVKVKPQPAEFHRWLTFEFTERKPDAATFALMWDKLQVPVKITVPNINEYYLATIRKELTNEPGFIADNIVTAINFCLQNNMNNLEELLQWSDFAISGVFVGEKKFTTLSAKAAVLNKLNRAKEADDMMKQAIPLGTVLEIHGYGRQLLAQKRGKEALEVFRANAKKHPNAWPVNWGLARGLSANGEYKEALKYAKQALTEAPDPQNKAAIESGIKKLEAGKDVNS